jgi:serine/threonine-protein kinase
VFLVMEYLEGETLSKVIEQGALAPERALTIAHQLATALARAHELDVIHRDIKPDNVFVLQRRGADFVKLLDFGLAKVVGEHRLTATGKIFGTPEYLAPEQARGETLTGQADQYSLGCVLYEMLTGSLPFEGTHPEVVLKHLQSDAVPPSARRSSLPLPRELDALVLRMLAKHPGERFADAYHLADELRQLLEQLSGGRSSRPPRRSGMVSIPPTASATQPWLDAAEETWAARWELFESLLPKAYPNGAVPERLRAALSEMEHLVERARGFRRELGDNVLRAKAHEDNLRAARMRVGHAADELGRDESRVTRRIAETRTALEQAEARVRDAAAPIAGGLKDVYAAGALYGPLSRSSAELLRQLGGQASLWLEAEAQLAPLSARLSAAEREREDLRFQIAQLKGRLGILNVDADGELGSLREQSDRLESALSTALDSLTRVADGVVHTLASVPSVRELLPTARVTAVPRESTGRG